MNEMIQAAEIHLAVGHCIHRSSCLEYLKAINYKCLHREWEIAQLVILCVAYLQADKCTE